MVVVRVVHVVLLGFLDNPFGGYTALKYLLICPGDDLVVNALVKVSILDPVEDCTGFRKTLKSRQWEDKAGGMCLRCRFLPGIQSVP